MKVNTKILSIPPYISTSWKNVLSLHIETRAEEPVLIIGLVNGSTIEIPKLDKASLESVFAAHEKHLDKEVTTPLESHEQPSFGEPFSDASSAILSLPLNFGLDSNMGNLLQHNQEAADSPDLPRDVIDKIAQLSKVIGLDNLDNFPKPEPHCNCMHCQIMRVIRDEEESRQDGQATLEEEEVSDEDLKFREWDIEQTGDNLYKISNPFNPEEQFSVFLGTPVGCTCGKKNCEHIRAVLNS